ncbi:MAG TPA: gliding motility-associated C-terminal domain-containing protein, partial [Saprospiraceae bacterium]|nr:gliding motility-associated C-terminal domain-containing protein [Saprospiraceae bacterium]
AGLWTVSALDAEGCVAVWTFTLDDPPVLTLYLEDVIAIQAGSSTTIPLEISLPGVYSYTWSPPEGLSCTDCQQPLASPSDSVWYAVTVTDSNGCKAEDAILIRVEKSGGIYIPTAFSPDGDGTNEVFQIAGDPSVIERIDVFQVYNRWGGLVFERRGAAPNDSGNGWDGTLRGKALPTDVYIWYAEIRLKNGEVLKKKGDVTLLR